MSDSVPKAVFLSKKEREERAIARLQERRNKERLALQESERKKENFLRRKADEVVNEKVAVESSDLEKEKERELTQIKEQYLGKRKRDKKSRKGLSGQRSKFRFEWDEDEDTAGGDLNPLYSQKLEPALAFGRGALGGIDKDEEIRSLKSETKSQMFSRGKFARDKSAVHWSEKTLAQMTERDWRIFSEDFNISVRGGNAIKPMRYWNEIEFPDEILRAVEEAGYKEPTPIQRQAIPLGLDRKDMIAIAQTGSGKTAAFVLPMLVNTFPIDHPSLYLLIRLS